jgi:sodium/hydrogen exchanger 8
MGVSFASIDALMICLVMLMLLFLSFWLERTRISYISESGAAMLCGMCMGLVILAFGTRQDVDADGFNDDLFFYGLLPPIILDAGFSMKKQKFLSNISTILSLAVFGTIVSTFVTGGILHYLGILPPAESYVFGALISATDPVSTLSVFKKVGAPEVLFNLVFGESVLNDAVAIALYEIFLTIANNNVLIQSEEFTVRMAAGAMLQLVYIGLASLLMSALVSLPTAFLLKQPYFRGLRHLPALEMGILLLSSYMGYILATILNLSGIIALFFSGLIMQVRGSGRSLARSRSRLII